MQLLYSIPRTEPNCLRLMCMHATRVRCMQPAAFSPRDAVRANRMQPPACLEQIAWTSGRQIARAGEPAGAPYIGKKGRKKYTPYI